MTEAYQRQSNLLLETLRIAAGREVFARKSTVAVHRRFHNVRLYPLGLDARGWFVPEGLRKY